MLKGPPFPPKNEAIGFALGAVFYSGCRQALSLPSFLLPSLLSRIYIFFSSPLFFFSIGDMAVALELSVNRALFLFPILERPETGKQTLFFFFSCLSGTSPRRSFFSRQVRRMPAPRCVLAGSFVDDEEPLRHRPFRFPSSFPKVPEDVRPSLSGRPEGDGTEGEAFETPPLRWP